MVFAYFAGMTSYAISNLDLSQRLERAEAAANASFVDARCKLDPTRGACWIDVDGTWAMFDGIESPLSQTFGLGLFNATISDQLDALESFFRTRSCGVSHEVSPLAERATVEQLVGRDYRPIDQTNVMHRPVGLPLAHELNAKIQVRLSTAAEVSLWAETSAAGWSEYNEVGAFMRDIAVVMSVTQQAYCFLAEIDECVAASAALFIHEGVASLAGASTIPEYRGKGAQLALLQARLRFASEKGCEVALVAAPPGSDAQCHAERQGFRIAYTRTTWRQV